jgi:polyferredoxin
VKTNTLKLIRIILAILVFSLIFLFFCDFAGIFPDRLHGLMHIQFIPAVLSGSVMTVIFLIALTLLFGRIYCSIICPLGVLQDVITWFTKRGKKKNRKRRWYNYARPLSILRYFILGICILFLFYRITTPLLLLDPYSNFGRIAVNLFRPVIMEGNNLLNWVALKFHIYHFYYVTIYTVTGWSVAIATTIFLIVGIMSLLRGRLFCNTICPVGTFLGLFSRFSLFRIAIDTSNCNNCGLCEKACKSQCINSKEHHVDFSRCVACFNCLDRCKTVAVDYRFVFNRSTKTVTAKEKNAPKTTIQTNEIGMTRRSFLVTSTVLAATLPVLPAWAKPKEEVDFTKLTPITPPGSISLEHFKIHCTACHLCVTHCPQQILKPAGFNFGINYAFKPHMVFYEMAYCNYECTICSEICPTGAIRKLTKETKKITQVGIAQFDEEHCIVVTDGTSCGACSEHCPTQAVKMEPYTGSLTLPHVDAKLCIGCGGCESICPARPIKAINILANAVHQTAEKPPEEKQDNEHQDLNFGF